MKKVYETILMLIVICLASPGIIRAQNDIRIQTDFKKIEMYMIKIWDLVQQFDDARAREYMALARTELDKARELIFGNDPRNLLARISMSKAKQYIDLAARRVLSQPFLNLKAQLDELVIHAENASAGSNSDEVHYLLTQAKKYRRLAYTSFSDNRIIRGEEYFRISFFFARKCIDYVNTGTANLSEQFENLENSVRQLITQADELITNNDNDHLKSLLTEAENHFEESLLIAEKGRLQMAINRLQLVKRLLYRIFDQAEQGNMSEEGRLENSLNSLRSMLTALEEEVENSSHTRMKNLMDRAWQLYREAEQEYEGKNYAKSQGKISLCERFADRILRLTRNQELLNVTELENQLRETQNLLSLQENRVHDSNNASILHLYQEANRMLERAQTALSAEQTAVAFQLIQAATRMSARIQRELRGASNINDKAGLENKYQRIMDSLHNLKNNEQINGRYGAILDQIDSFAQRGKKYLDEGNNLIADEYFNTALEQINTYTDKWRNLSELQ